MKASLLCLDELLGYGQCWLLKRGCVGFKPAVAGGAFALVSRIGLRGLGPKDRAG